MKRLLNVKIIAKETGFSPPTVYSWFHREDFPVIRLGRKLVVAEDAFDAWLEKQANGNKEQ